MKGVGSANLRAYWSIPLCSLGVGSRKGKKMRGSIGSYVTWCDRDVRSLRTSNWKDNLSIFTTFAIGS